MNFSEGEQSDLGSSISTLMSHETKMEQVTPTVDNNGTALVNSSSDSCIHAPESSMEFSSNWEPLVVSTPTVTTAPQSDKDIENELFDDIQEIVRKFIVRPNRDYPYYRVMRWLEGDDPKLEHFVTVVINRPTIMTKRQ